MIDDDNFLDIGSKYEACRLRYLNHKIQRTEMSVGSQEKSKDNKCGGWYSLKEMMIKEGITYLSLYTYLERHEDFFKPLFIDDWYT